jgi:valyl-tRNA synthetase
MSELAPTYNPKEYEARLYQHWLDKKYFEANRDSGKKPFTILMPPPNVTAQLHMGHGVGYTMQDILVRWKRMSGFEALWLPGTDHAGIATQMMVERSLAEEGKTKADLGRDKFVEKCQAWKEKYGGMILQQFKGMGFSCDWSRLAYTMDPGLSKAVRRIFVDLFNDGLIYRGERLVNWDPVLKTAISDDEIESVELSGALWHLRYPIDGSTEQIIIATTRPETMLGDTAVAVHPDDERYKHLVGKNVKLPLTGRLIPIIADEYVKSDFGSGCVKITPAHDPNDFEIGKRHKLPFINIMNDDASMNNTVPERFRGLDRFVARKEVIKAMKELDLFEKEESHRNVVPHSERSKCVIEPKLSLQWWVDMKTIAKPAVDVAKSGELKFHPDLWKKTYLHWMENIQDWCISRQLWWGHRIPIWYCDDCNHAFAEVEDPSTCSKCHSKKIRQDEDVLDTWFSSWLWPVSPMGWPDESPDLKHFYPTDVLVTAPEIIFLWVARMVMVGLKTRGEVPFKDVFLTATVCDKQGRKFSKTLGNGIDPLEVIDKHGTDAVRFTGVQLAPLGGRVKMSLEDFETGGRFVNKIWNASRFLMGYLTPGQKLKKLSEIELDLPGKWLLTELSDAAATVDKNLAAYRINDAVDAVYQTFWGTFCDWSLEISKRPLNGSDQKKKDDTLSLLVYALDTILRLAHPVIPFITEEIWQKLPAHPDLARRESIVISAFPTTDSIPRYPSESEEWKTVQALISGIRSVRTQAVIPPKTQLDAIVKADPKIAALFNSFKSDIIRLANLKEFSADPAAKPKGQSLVDVGKGYETYVPAEGLIDIEKEKKRMQSEIQRIEKIVKGLESKLSNKAFVDRAPEDVIVATKEQLANMGTQMASLRRNLASLV